MKRFLTTTAIALAMGASAYAASHTGSFSDMAFDEKVNLNASELIGMRVYATETDIDHTTAVRADGEVEWNDIGEINEIVLTRDGAVRSVIVGVGGFVGLGEKDVAVDMSQLKFVSDGEDPDEFFLVVKSSIAGVEDAPAYRREAIEDMSAETAEDMTAETAIERPMLKAPMIEREGYAPVEPDDLTAAELTGARVYGPDDEDVGEVGELLLTNDGELDRVVIDVGGFLGLGEHPVAVTLDELEIVQTRSGDDLRVYIDSSQAALEQQPAYEG